MFALMRDNVYYKLKRKLTFLQEHTLKLSPTLCNDSEQNWTLCAAGHSNNWKQGPCRCVQAEHLSGLKEPVTKMNCGRGIYSSNNICVSQQETSSASTNDSIVISLKDIHNFPKSSWNPKLLKIYMRKKEKNWFLPKTEIINPLNM